MRNLFWAGAAILLVVGFAFFYLRSRWQHRYDPNDAIPADLRKLWGEAFSVSKEEDLMMTTPSA